MCLIKGSSKIVNTISIITFRHSRYHSNLRRIGGQLRVRLANGGRKQFLQFSLDIEHSITSSRRCSSSDHCLLFATAATVGCGLLISL